MLLMLLLLSSLAAGFSAQNLAAQNDQGMFPVSSAIYEYLDVVAAEAGEVPNHFERPATRAQILDTVDEIDYGKLSPAARRLYDEIMRELEVEPDYTEGDGLAVAFEAELNLETYLQEDPDHVEWKEAEHERLPFLNFPIQAWLFDSVYTRVEFPLKKVPFVYEDKARHLGRWTNVPLTMSQIDYQYPPVAYISAGGSHWNVQAGRDALSYGSGRSGNFLIGEHIPYYNFVRAKTFWDAFTFYYTVIDLEKWNTGAENIGDEDERNVQRTLMSHGFVFNFIPRLRLSVRESSMLTDYAPTIQYLNPFFAFHNWYVETNNEDNPIAANSILTVDAKVNVARGLNLYGVLTVDQYQTFFEIYRYDSGSTPNAYGYMLGTELSVPAGKGYWLGNVEWVYTNPWLYIHEKSNATLIWTGQIESNVDGSFYKHLPIGYPTGPDSMNLFASIGYTKPRAYRLKGGYEMKIKGAQNVIETVWEKSGKAASMTTPTGVIERSHTAWLEGAVQPKGFGPLEELGSGLAYIWLANEHNIRGEDYRELQVSFHVGLRF